MHEIISRKTRDNRCFLCFSAWRYARSTTHGPNHVRDRSRYVLRSCVSVNETQLSKEKWLFKMSSRLCSAFGPKLLREHLYFHFFYSAFLIAIWKCLKFLYQSGLKCVFVMIFIFTLRTANSSRFLVWIIFMTWTWYGVKAGGWTAFFIRNYWFPSPLVFSIKGTTLCQQYGSGLYYCDGCFRFTSIDLNLASHERFTSPLADSFGYFTVRSFESYH